MFRLRSIFAWFYVSYFNQMLYMCYLLSQWMSEWMDEYVRLLFHWLDENVLYRSVEVQTDELTGHAALKMPSISTLCCTIGLHVQTLILFFVVPRYCLSSATINHAASIQLSALQCKYNGCISWCSLLWPPLRRPALRTFTIVIIFAAI